MATYTLSDSQPLVSVRVDAVAGDTINGCQYLECSGQRPVWVQIGTEPPRLMQPGARSTYLTRRSVTVLPGAHPDAILAAYWVPPAHAPAPQAVETYTYSIANLAASTAFTGPWIDCGFVLTAQIIVSKQGASSSGEVLELRGARTDLAAPIHIIPSGVGHSSAAWFNASNASMRTHGISMFRFVRAVFTNGSVVQPADAELQISFIPLHGR